MRTGNLEVLGLAEGKMKLKQTTKPKYVIKKICAWCHADLGEIETDRADQHLSQSHGICDECSNKYFPKGVK